MSYIINNSRGNIVAIIPDGVVNTANTSLALIGQAVTNYGALQNENFVYLLENFASNVAPLTPILGQLWYNSDTGVLSAYNNANAWTSMASTDDVTVAITASKISPAFSGVPTAPTATSGTSNTQIATTAFVQNAFTNFSGNASLTGNSTAVTAAFGTNTTQIATTAFVQSALSGGGTGNTTVTGNLSVTGGVLSLTYVSAVGNVTGGNILTSGLISATGPIASGGNISGGNLIGTHVGAVAFGANTIFGSGNITGGNLIGTHVGSVVFGTGTVSGTGNITGGNIIAGNVTAGTVYATNFVTSGTPTTAFRLPNLNQTQINALSAQNGDMVYNTTEDLPQVYQNGSWKNFTISYYS